MALACFCANLRASSVCGMKPSSAATTSTAMSVTEAPRSRIVGEGGVAGVSRKVTVLPLYSGFAPVATE
jgi:hypothetical protein